MFTAILGLLLTQPPPTPQPFPKPTASSPAKPTSAEPPAPQATQPAPSVQAPSEATLGVPLYPGSQFITAYDTGRGQRFYLFGTTGSFVTLVTYYRTVLKNDSDSVEAKSALDEVKRKRAND